MKKTCPKWLVNPAAREFWQQHASRLIADGILTPITEVSFSLLCNLYADYRNATETRERNKCLDNYLKLAPKFSLVPHISTVKSVAELTQKEASIDPVLEKLIAG